MLGKELNNCDDNEAFFWLINMSYFKMGDNKMSQPQERFAPKFELRKQDGRESFSQTIRLLIISSTDYQIKYDIR